MRLAPFRISARSNPRRRIPVDFQIRVDVGLVVQPLDESQISEFLSGSAHVFQVQAVLRIEADEILSVSIP